MDLLKHIKSEFIGTYKNAYSLISLFFTPIIMVFVLTISIDNNDFKSYAEYKINISIENMGNDVIYNDLVTYFRRDKFKNVINITPKEKADVLINVQDNKSDGINKVNVVNLSVSKSNGEVIKLLVDEEVKKVLLEEGIKSNPNDKKIMESTLIERLEKEGGIKINASALRAKDDKEKVYPYIFLAAFSIFPYILVNSSLTLNIKKEFSGIRKRASLIPIHPLDTSIYDLASTLCIQIPAWIMFILIAKLIDTSSFSGNLLNYILVAGIIYVFLTSLKNIISVITNFKVAFVVIFIIYMCNLLALVIPYRKLNELYGGIFMDFPLIKYLYIPYIKVYEGGNFSPFITIGFVLTSLSLFFIVAERLLLKRRLNL